MKYAYIFKSLGFRNKDTVVVGLKYNAEEPILVSQWQLFLSVVTLNQSKFGTCIFYTSRTHCCSLSRYMTIVCLETSEIKSHFFWGGGKSLILQTLLSLIFTILHLFLKWYPTVKISTTNCLNSVVYIFSIHLLSILFINWETLQNSSKDEDYQSVQ